VTVENKMEFLVVPEGTAGVAAGVFVHLDTLISWLEEIADLCVTEDLDSCSSLAFSVVAQDLRERFDLESLLTEPTVLVVAK